MIAPTCFGISLSSSGSVPSAFWEMLKWGAVDRMLWMGVLCLVTWCACAPHHQTDWIIGVFVGISRIFLLGILIFKGLAARRLNKSFCVKGLINDWKRGVFNSRYISPKQISHVSSGLLVIVIRTRTKKHARKIFFFYKYHLNKNFIISKACRNSSSQDINLSLASLPHCCYCWFQEVKK
jgi:hypothetical protein